MGTSFCLCSKREEGKERLMEVFQSFTLTGISTEKATSLQAHNERQFTRDTELKIHN